MISVRRPSAQQVAAYRAERSSIEPTCLPADAPPPGFRAHTFRRTIGPADAFERACLGLRRWAPHRHAAVEPYPGDAPIEEGETVGLLMRQPGTWILAACRIVEVINEPDRFGFVYATLPGHLEDGYESFVIINDGTELTFEVDMVARPGTWLVRCAGPIATFLQHRAVNAYLTGLERWVDAR